MTPHYQDDWLTVYHGDSRAVMAEMEPESVHCVVTSPPYWGLRDYGTATWLGGDEGCDHLRPVQNRNDRPAGAFHGGSDDGNDSREPRYKDVCARCGATRQDGQLGLEPTPEAYVANMVAVFREVRRVLRSDGTVWLNLGDSYANTGQSGLNNNGGGTSTLGITDGPPGRGLKQWDETRRPPQTVPPGLKPKDLVGIPWRVAFALQADGWYLRSDIIWSKPNPMPESVTDRPTKSHEYLFLLSKSPRYYFDADAVREAVSDTPGAAAWRRIFDPAKQAKEATLKAVGTKGGNDGQRDPNATGRNIRSVWTIATAPYPGAHFATFPPKLVEPCIKAGTSERGVCPECGRHWRRVTESGFIPHQATYAASGGAAVDAWTGGGGVPGWKTSRTLSWIPSCAHGHEPVPATVLDPFAGSGTTGMVAQSLSRKAVLIDLSMDYLGQLMTRNRHIPLGLGS